MEAVDWASLAVVAGMIVTLGGYMTRLVHRVEDTTRQDMAGVRVEIAAVRAEVSLLNERYVRHLERHAGHA